MRSRARARFSTSLIQRNSFATAIVSVNRAARILFPIGSCWGEIHSTLKLLITLTHLNLNSLLTQ